MKKAFIYDNYGINNMLVFYTSLSNRSERKQISLA